MIRLLLACGGLSLLLIGARGQAGAAGIGEGIDGLASRPIAMVFSVADAATLDQQPPALATPHGAAIDNALESEGDDDGDEVFVDTDTHSHVTRSLKRQRITVIAPARSRDFATLPRRAPPV
jgi:hypothetical protein